MALFHVGASVQYYSTSHGCWVDAVVEDERENGDIQVSCKQGYWMPPSEQQQRLRAAAPSPGWAKPSSPAQAAGQAAAPGADAGGCIAKAAGGGYPKGATPAVPPAAARAGDVTGEWTADQAIGLGPHGADDLGSWAKPIDRSLVSSVHTATEKLNQAEIQCAEDFCTVYSVSSKGHYLLYRRGSREKALQQLMQHLREVASAAASMREENARLRQAAGGKEARGPFESLNSNATSRLEAVSEEVSRLHATLSEETARSAELQLANDALRRDLSQAQETAAAAERDAAGLQAALDEERGQRALLQDEHDKLLEAWSNKEQEALKQAQSGESLKAYLKAAEEELSLQTALEEESSQRKLLEERQTELQEHLQREAEARERAQEELAKAKAELLAKQRPEDLGAQIPSTAPSLAQRRDASEPLEEGKAVDVRKERREGEEKAEKEERQVKEEKAAMPGKDEKEEKEEKREGLPREGAEPGGEKAEACESKAEGVAEARREKAAPEEKLQGAAPPDGPPEDCPREPPAGVAEEKLQGAAPPDGPPEDCPREPPAGVAEERAKGEPEQKLETDRSEQVDEGLRSPKASVQEAKADLEEKLPESGPASATASCEPPDPPPEPPSEPAAAAIGTLPVRSIAPRDNPFAE